MYSNGFENMGDKVERVTVSNILTGACAVGLVVAASSSPHRISLSVYLFIKKKKIIKIPALSGTRREVCKIFCGEEKSEMNVEPLGKNQFQTGAYGETKDYDDDGRPNNKTIWITFEYPHTSYTRRHGRRFLLLGGALSSNIVSRPRVSVTS